LEDLSEQRPAVNAWESPLLELMLARFNTLTSFVGIAGCGVTSIYLALLPLWRLIPRRLLRLRRRLIPQADGQAVRESWRQVSARVVGGLVGAASALVAAALLASSAAVLAWLNAARRRVFLARGRERVAFDLVAAERARDAPEIALDHSRSPEISRDLPRFGSLEITRDHSRSLETTPDTRRSSWRTRTRAAKRRGSRRAAAQTPRGLRLRGARARLPRLRPRRRRLREGAAAPSGRGWRRRPPRGARRSGGGRRRRRRRSGRPGGRRCSRGRSRRRWPEIAPEIVRD